MTVLRFRVNDIVSKPSKEVASSKKDREKAAQNQITVLNNKKAAANDSNKFRFKDKIENELRLGKNELRAVNDRLNHIHTTLSTLIRSGQISKSVH